MANVQIHALVSSLWVLPVDSRWHRNSYICQPFLLNSQRAQSLDLTPSNHRFKCPHLPTTSDQTMQKANVEQNALKSMNGYSPEFLKKSILITYICVWIYVCICVNVWHIRVGACGGQIRMLDPLQLDLRWSVTSGEIWNLVLRKSSMCFYPLSHLSSSKF